VDQTFFDTYCTDHPLRPGFDRRCRIYWLYTAMRHATTYDPAYLDSCERLAKELSQHL
jgi:fructosamine-3-kinase